QDRPSGYRTESRWSGAARLCGSASYRRPRLPAAAGCAGFLRPPRYGYGIARRTDRQGGGHGIWHSHARDDHLYDRGPPQHYTGIEYHVVPAGTRTYRRPCPQPGPVRELPDERTRWPPVHRG